MQTVLQHFAIEENVLTCVPYGNGHINHTHLVTTDTGRRYILQKINNSIFRNVEGLMRNVHLVTDYLHSLSADPDHTLTLIPTRTGEAYLAHTDGGFYRVYNFVENSVCLDRVESMADFKQSGWAFGLFQLQLADFPAHTLVETIPQFHDTRNRYAQFHAALKADIMQRAETVKPEIEFILAHEEVAATMMNMLEAGELPLRVTHNDTKLNNVMLHAETREPLCVIDLDTVMPGLAGNDFGDSIRFGASTAAEDEKDLNLVEMDLALFEAYAEGFLAACGSRLTQAEIDTLPLAAKLMTLECGVRFLTDYLQGDTYFRIHRPEHNLDRARTQFKLVADMETKEGAMNAIIRRIAANITR